MPPTTAPAPRSGSSLPSGSSSAARSAVRGAARAVVATVGAVLAGLVLALPAVHLPLAAASTGPQTAVVSFADHGAVGLAARAAAVTAAGPVAGAGPAARSVVGPVVLATPAVVQVLTAPGPARAALVALVADPAPGAPWVLLAAALVGLSRPLDRRTPARPSRLGPAPLRGPPAGLAPAP